MLLKTNLELHIIIYYTAKEMIHSLRKRELYTNNTEHYFYVAASCRNLNT